MIPSNNNILRNVANHALFWWKISLVKTLLAETFPLFPCLINLKPGLFLNDDNHKKNYKSNIQSDTEKVEKFPLAAFSQVKFPPIFCVFCVIL